MSLSSFLSLSVSFKSHSPLSVGALGSQKASPQAAGKALAEKYRDKQNITADELRRDYNSFKAEYQTVFGQKPTGLQKQAFVKSFCEGMGVSIETITSTHGLSCSKVDDAGFGFESYCVSLVARINERNSPRNRQPA